MDDAWSALAPVQEPFTLKQLVDELFDLMIGFIDAHPAYLLLLEAPIGYARDRKAKEQLRERVGARLVTQQLASDAEQDLLKVNVVLQIVKGLIPLYAASKAAERVKLIAEFELAVRRYLSPA